MERLKREVEVAEKRATGEKFTFGETVGNYVMLYIRS